MKKRESGKICFPRTDARKVYRWKRLNFPTLLPKSAPLVSYVVAACYETNPIGH